MVRVRSKKSLTMSRLLPAGLILLLTVTSLLLSAFPAQASVTNSGAWTSVYNGLPGTAAVNATSSAYTVGGTHGDKRVVLVAFIAGTNTATVNTIATAPTVTLGNVPVTLITRNNGSQVVTWLGYVREDKIPAGTPTVNVSYTGSTTTANLKIYCATFSGVDQAQPVITSGQSARTTAGTAPTAVALTFGTTDFAVMLAANNVDTPVAYTPATYTAPIAGTFANAMSVDFGHRATGTAATAESTNATFTLATGYPAFSVAVLKDDLSALSCNACHGYPPVDNATRDATAGTFPGSHNRHAGTVTSSTQYGYSCSSCHRDQTSSNHSRGSITMANPLNGNTNAKYGTYTSYTVSNAALAGKTCTNTYCHSNGTGGTKNLNDTRTVVANTTSAAWGGSRPTCTGCHGSGADGRPNYSSGTVFGGLAKANTHGDGAGYGTTHLATACTRCHDSVTGSAGAYTVNPLSHANGTYSVGAANVGYTYAVTGGTCNATGTGCHSTSTVTWGGVLGCPECHTGAIGSPIASALNSTITTRRDIVGEFKQVWSHKRSSSGGVPANTVVTSADCIVCHMEGNSGTQKTDAAYHKNGYIDLRDPDTGNMILGATWGGTNAGGYGPTASPVNALRFSRNLASTTLEPFVTAIMINQCLKCHDSGGATVAFVSGGSAQKPFNTTITGTAYTGAGVTAGGTLGAVTDINASFAVTNASYHPVLGKQNNGWTSGTKMVAPWNMTKTTGTTTTWGYLMTCWDCHAPDGTANVVITSTVTAHGGATTLRGVPAVTGTPAATTNEVTLCKICHAGYNGTVTTNYSHGTGSAFSGSTGRSAKFPYLNYGCNMCHSSSYATAAVRPVRAIDVHGSNTVPAGSTTKTGRWASASNNGPIAFIRNSNMFSNHQPAKIGNVTYTPQCMGGANSPCSQGTQSYSAGGTY